MKTKDFSIIYVLSGLDMLQWTPFSFVPGSYQGISVRKFECNAIGNTAHLILQKHGVKLY